MVKWEHIKKNNHLVMVVPRKKLFGEDDKFLVDGFVNASACDYWSRMSSSVGFLTRGSISSNNDGEFAESDENYLQVLPYVVLINRQKKQVYAYRRASSSDAAHEARLHGNWSWGVGGHIDFQEDYFSSSFNNFLLDNLFREVEEEVCLDDGKILNVELLGFINDRSNSVGRVHLGVVYVGYTDATNIRPNDVESSYGELMSLNQLEEIVATPGVMMDNWSRLLMVPLRRLLKK